MSLTHSQEAKRMQELDDDSSLSQITNAWTALAAVRRAFMSAVAQ
jgi:hypothetical protein